MYIRMRVLCIYVCTYMCVCMYVYTYVCIYVFKYLCACVCMYVCTNICVYVCIMYYGMGELLALKIKWELSFICLQRNYLGFLLRASVRAVLLTCARRSK